MPRLKQTILILAAAAALLLPACSPSDDVTLPAPAAECITVTTPPKPAFSGDGAQTRFNEEIGRWDVGDVAEMILRIKKADDSEDQNGYTLTCVAVNTDGSAEWKIEDFSIDLKDIIKIQYSFGYSYSDSYGITTDLINSDGEIDINSPSIITDRGLNLPLTNMNHFYSRFRLTGLQKGDYVMINDIGFRSFYTKSGYEAINNIRFIAADDEDTYIYGWSNLNTPVTITVARRGVTLSKKLDMDSENGKAYSIDISTFKAFDGENPQDVTWIHNATELLSFSEDVNSSMDYAGKTVRLACDIDWYENTNFPVIGDNDRPFNGIFDGNGYTIRNLDIKGYDIAALFYKIGETATVKNLTLENIKVTNNDNASCFAYENNGTIDHCAVRGGTVNISGGAGVASGFVYKNGGTITYCMADAQLLGTIGTFGFATENLGKIERCGAKGTIALSRYKVSGFIYGNTSNSYTIGCYTDVKLVDGSIPCFSYNANNGIAHCRNGNEKVNDSSWGDDTGWYRTDTPKDVLKLFWEE